MAARKLQSEIERTFKKVQEGISAFDDIQFKLDASNNPSQKEKLESDLKKEIKRLQRLRDQIKLWAASNEIKDKKPLLENRKLIEMKMEEFKAVEKEMKTKAFSKEGLSAGAKLDPKEREKLETRSWLSSMVDELERQIEQLEAEAESLRLAVKKKGKDQSKKERLTEVEHFLEKHKWHQDNLEHIMRMVENESLSVSQVHDIKDDVVYYVDSNQDPDFAEDDNIYDELDLTLDEPVANATAAEKSSTDEKEKVLENANTSHTSVQVAPNTRDQTAKEQHTHPAPLASAVVATATVNKKTNASKGTSSATMSSIADSEGSAGLLKIKSPAKPDNLQYANAVAARKSVTTTKAVSSGSASAANTLSQADGATARARTVSTGSKGTGQLFTGESSDSKAASIESQTLRSPEEKMKDILSGNAERDVQIGPKIDSENLIPSVKELVASFDRMKEQANAGYSLEKLNSALSESFKNVIEASDSSSPDSYRPKNPRITPYYYPQLPLKQLQTPAVVEKMDLDTLFFMFYYQGDTYAQSLAARELKKQSWRFHKKYLTWFQRHEEPSKITEEYESGTYRYFDYEGSWVQRKKSDFKFMYSFLEDED